MDPPVGVAVKRTADKLVDIGSVCTGAYSTYHMLSDTATKVNSIWYCQFSERGAY